MSYKIEEGLNDFFNEIIELNELQAEAAKNIWKIHFGGKTFTDPGDLKGASAEAYKAFEFIRNEIRKSKNTGAISPDDPNSFDIVMKGDGTAVLTADKGKTFTNGKDKVVIKNPALKF